MRRTYRRRPQKPTGPQYRYNNLIAAPEVRLVGAAGENFGVVSIEEAKKHAAEAELDLVEVSPQAKPPVVKILDYSQFKYQRDKEAQKAKTKQRKQEIKGIRLSFRIGEHDEGVRLKQATKFLSEGHKLKIELQLRGREHQHKEIASGVILDFVKKLEEQFTITIEQQVQKQGRKLSLICFSTGKVADKEEKQKDVVPTDA